MGVVGLEPPPPDRSLHNGGDCAAPLCSPTAPLTVSAPARTEGGPDTQRVNGPNGLQTCLLSPSSSPSLSREGPVHPCESTKKPRLGSRSRLTFHSAQPGLGLVASNPRALGPASACPGQPPLQSSVAVSRDPTRGWCKVPAQGEGKGGPCTHHRISFLVRKVRAYNKPQRRDLPTPSSPALASRGAGSFGGWGGKVPVLIPQPGKGNGGTAALSSSLRGGRRGNGLVSLRWPWEGGVGTGLERGPTPLVKD